MAADDDTLYGRGVSRLKRLFPDDPLANVERPVWDSVAQEPARLAGTTVRLYALRRAKNRHPLYAEPSVGGDEWEYHGPWEIWASIEWEQADIDTDAKVEGVEKSADAVAWIARKELDDAEAPDPKVGDVMEFWDQDPFARKDFRFWDIVKANPTGNIFSSEVFTMWRLELKHRTKFDPARKVEGDRI